MENIEHRLLGLAFQIDEQVPAGDEIEMGKGRIFQHIMWRKKDQLADFFFNPVTPMVAKKEPPQSLLRDIGFNCHRIDSSAPVLHRFLVDIGRKNLNCRGRIEPFGLFAK